MPIEIDTIIEQMEWAASRGLAEFSTNLADTQIHIWRSGGSVKTPYPSDATVALKSTVSEAGPVQTIIAPMAGICHLSGENNGPVFVNVGDAIEVDQTVCLIEAMKMMTLISATASGTVKAILVEDGDAVDAGAALFEVVP